MVQDQALLLTHVHIVVVTGKYDLTRVFLLFNKPVLNVMELEKKSQTLVTIVMVKEKLKHQKKYQLLFQGELMMVQELDLPEKEKLEAEEDQQVIFIYLLMFIHMTYLRDQMKIYFLSFLYPLLTLRLEQRLKFQQLMVVKQK